MPKYINADEMLKEESEAYTGAQTKISDIETYIINYLVHAKIQRRLHDAPAADVQEVKHAYWEARRESEITGWNPEFAGRDPIGGYYCSNCHYEAIYSCNDEYVLSAYCPNCGARMDASEKA